MKLLRAAGVMERFGIRSRETLRQMWKRGTIPPPFKIEPGGPNNWFDTEIDSAMEKIAAEHDRKAAA